MQKALPPELDKTFKGYIHLVKVGKVSELHSLFVEEIRSKLTVADLKKNTQLLNTLTDRMEAITAQSNTVEDTNNSVKKYFQVSYDVVTDRSAYPHTLVTIAARDFGKGIELLGINMREMEKSYKELVKFDLTKQWLDLLLSLFCFLLITCMGYQYLTKAKNPKWWLLLVILFAAPVAKNNGDFYSIGIGAEAFMQRVGLYGPWNFVIPIPLGAIFYLFVRNKHEA